MTPDLALVVALAVAVAVVGGGAFILSERAGGSWWIRGRR